MTQRAYSHLTWLPDNLFSQDTASANTTIGSWHGTLNGTITATPSSVVALDGAFSVEANVTASGDAVYLTGEGLAGVPVVGGQSISAAVQVRAGATGRSVHMSLVFYDQFGALLTTETISGSTATDATGSWTQYQVVGTVPTDAAFVAGKVTITAGGASEKHYFDEAYVSTASSVPIFTPGIGDIFAAYEIWRDDGDGYEQIGDIETLLTNQYDDYEARRGVTASYKMRTRTIDGATSVFTAVDAVVTPDTVCEWGFVTNEAPDLNLWYQSLGPDTSFDFTDDATAVKLYNRDYEVVFRPLEKTGDKFTLTLFLAGDPQIVPVLPGRVVFTPIVTLARAPLSYVCVLDSDGNRWFAALFPQTGKRTEPRGTYTIDVQISEITATPSKPSVSPAGV